MNHSQNEQGFTLLEVLVALVVAGLLVAVLANGAISANQSVARTDNQAEKLIIAETVLNNAIARRPLINAKGDSNGIAWEVSVETKAQDARGTATLFNITVKAGNQNPVVLSRRLLVMRNEGNG